MFPYEETPIHSKSNRNLRFGGRRNQIFTRLIVRWLERLHSEFNLPYRPFMLSESKAVTGFKFYWKCLQDLPDKEFELEIALNNSIKTSIEQLHKWEATQIYLSKFFLEVIYQIDNPLIRSHFPRNLSPKNSIDSWLNQSVVNSISLLVIDRNQKTANAINGEFEVSKLLQNVKIARAINQLDDQLAKRFQAHVNALMKTNEGLSLKSLRSLIAGAIIYLLTQYEYQHLQYGLYLYGLEFAYKNQVKRVSESQFEITATSFYMIYKLATGVRTVREESKATIVSEFDPDFQLVKDECQQQFQQLYGLFRQRMGLFNLRHMFFFPVFINELDNWFEYYLRLSGESFWKVSDNEINSVVVSFMKTLELESIKKEEFKL
jgi:hypothetical protein